MKSGRTKFRAVIAVFCLLLATTTHAVNVLTQHNDNFRTGANLSEYVLTTSNVNSTLFGKLFTRNVDGQVYAQPLYVNSVLISNQIHNVVYVCTEHNSVYAFDADNAANTNALWHANLGPSVPVANLNGCSDITVEVGITATPVIDAARNTLYVEAKSLESGNYIHRLHALDLVTGQEKLAGPVVIQANVPGTGDGGTTVSFDPQHEANRPALLLLNNTVYLAYASHCDWAPYHGWVLGYTAAPHLAQRYVFNVTPNGSEGGIWSCGTGPAADENGNIYVITGNGSFNADTGGPNLGDSFIKLSVSNNALVAASSFTPFNQGTLDAADLDLGSGGAMLLPGTKLVAGLSKQGMLYLLNRDNMGGFSTAGSDTNIVQEFMAVTATCCIGQSPVYWNGPTNQFLFTWSGSDVIKAFNFTGSSLQTTPLAQGNLTQARPGGLSLSANLNTPGSGILWGTYNLANGTLVAYDAGNVAHELWDSQQKAARDSLGNYVKFASPTIANGKVYVPTANALVVYGLVATPYQTWQQSNFTSAELANPAISGDTADPDQDGIPNLMEYAFQLNPKTPDADCTPAATIQNFDGTDYQVITYNQVLYDTDISYTVEVSTDLVTWNSGPGFTMPVLPPTDNGDGTQTWVVRDAIPFDSSSMRFIRVKITH